MVTPAVIIPRADLEFVRSFEEEALEDVPRHDQRNINPH